MGKLLIKKGVDFGPELAPAGARILEILKTIVAGYSHNIVITSARDGIHSGPNDPHLKGEAFDLRTNTLQSAQKLRLIGDLQIRLGARFFVFLEAPNTLNEHIHCQRKRHTIYTVQDYLANA